MTSYINDPQTISQAKGGNEKAMAEVIGSNLGLVKSIALRFAGRGVDLEDLIQIGTIGMIKAVNGFDPEKECRFTTYAVPLIMGELKRFLRDDGWIKVGREAKQNAVRIFRFMEEYEKEHGVSPTLPVICENTGISAEKAVLALESSRPAMSLYEEDESTGFSPEKVIGEDHIEDTVSKIALRQAVESLPSEEKKLILLRYFKSLTQEQTARMMGMTQVKVSREEKRILKKLQRELNWKE